MVQVQPNKAFLGEKESFKVDIASLDTLLAYTEKDDKEAMFEVSIFAELFREMLEARFGQGILRVLEVLEKEDRLVCHQHLNHWHPDTNSFWCSPALQQLGSELCQTKHPALSSRVGDWYEAASALRFGRHVASCRTCRTSRNY